MKIDGLPDWSNPFVPRLQQIELSVTHAMEEGASYLIEVMMGRVSEERDEWEDDWIVG